MHSPLLLHSFALQHTALEPRYLPTPMANLRRRYFSDVNPDISASDISPQKAQGEYQSIFLLPISLSTVLSTQPVDLEKDRSFVDFNWLKLRSICIFLHVLLVLLHAAMFVVWRYHFEHRFVVPLSRSGITSSVLVAVSQLFALVCARLLCNKMLSEPGQVYTVVLVVITQKLATQGMLLKPQTLTATHDESVAWSGLGSALLVLLKQTRIPASVLGTLLIAIYLIGISVLHISTPSLFNLQVF